MKEFFSKHTAVVAIAVTLVIAIPLTFSAIRKPQLIAPQAATSTSTSFAESFDGLPATPERFNNDNPSAAHIDVVANESDAGAVGADENASFQPLEVHHGDNCQPPVTNDTPSALLVTHHIDNINDAVYKCKDHIMTGLLSGYAAAYLTPDHMVDFSQGEAVIRFDVTSLRTSGRDWIDLWLTPFTDKFVIPLERWNAPYNGEPKNAVHIRADGNNDGSYHFEGAIYRNNAEEGMNAGPNTIYGGVKTAFSNSGAVKTVTINGTPTTIPVDISPKRRDTYELRISKTSAKFCLVTINVQQEDATKQPFQTNQCWLNSTFANLGWDKAVLQFGHHAYNPQKDCSPTPLSVPAIDQGCRAVTWHWDEFKISPSIPMTLIKPTAASPKFIQRDMSVTLSKPSPVNAYLSFVAVAGSVEASFNNGATWTTLPRQPQVRNSPEHFSNYFAPIPAGVTTIKFRGNQAADWLNRFVVQHVAVYSQTAGPTPTPCVGAGCPTATPTLTPVPPTPTPSPVPPGALILDFNALPTDNLSNEYPTGVINWGNTAWDISPAWKGLTTNNLAFRSQSITSGTFTLIAPRPVTSIQAFNGAATTATITLACPGNTTKTQTVNPDQLVTITTGWTSPCTTVTLTSSNGWDTNFDNLALGAAASSGSPTPTGNQKPGDINRDGSVNILDYTILFDNYSKQPIPDPRADLNNDGKVNVIDYSILFENYGT